MIDRQIREIFPGVYMSLISVLQAIALDRLVDSVFSQSIPNQTIDVIVLFLEALFLFHIILSIWLSYALITIPLRWTFDASDFATPFTIAVLQYVGIAYLGFESKLPVFLAIFVGSLIGSWHVSNNIRRAKRDSPSRYSQNFPLKSVRTPYLLLAASGLVGVILVISKFPQDIAELIGLICVNVCLLLSTRSWLVWWSSYNSARRTTDTETQKDLYGNG